MFFFSRFFIKNLFFSSKKRFFRQNSQRKYVFRQKSIFFVKKVIFFVKNQVFHQKLHVFRHFSSKTHYFRQFFFLSKNTSLSPTLANVSHFWAFRASRLDETLEMAKIASQFFCKSPPGSAIWALARGSRRQLAAAGGSSRQPAAAGGTPRKRLTDARFKP